MRKGVFTKIYRFLKCRNRDHSAQYVKHALQNAEHVTVLSKGVYAPRKFSFQRLNLVANLTVI